MTGTKTNERPGTRAQVRYLRMSASKARVVLDLIRDKHVAEAGEVLAFSERLAAKEVQKVLRSAIANAVHNDEIPAEELYVSACYADEGPTLKRFRPRARGRAGRIHKQTCHITVIVSRLSDEKLDNMRNRAERRGQAPTSSTSRAARVAKSRGEQDAEASDAAEVESDEDVTAEEIAADEVVAAEEVAADEVVVAEEVAVEEVTVDESAVEEIVVDEASTEATPNEDTESGADA
jgi:large subunit ribosomal protein L22